MKYGLQEGAHYTHYQDNLQNSIELLKVGDPIPNHYEVLHKPKAIYVESLKKTTLEEERAAYIENNQAHIIDANHQIGADNVYIIVETTEDVRYIEYVEVPVTLKQRHKLGDYNVIVGAKTRRALILMCEYYNKPEPVIRVDWRAERDKRLKKQALES
jgi:ribosomal protein L24